MRKLRSIVVAAGIVLAVSAPAALASQSQDVWFYCTNGTMGSAQVTSLDWVSLPPSEIPGVQEEIMSSWQRQLHDRGIVATNTSCEYHPTHDDADFARTVFINETSADVIG